MSYSSSDQNMHTLSNGYPECGELSDPQNRYGHSLTSRTTESIISLLLRKNAERKRSHHPNDFPQHFDPTTSLNNSYYDECRTSTLSEDGETTQVLTSPFSPSWDHSCLENHRVKRARVENILQRMVGSPPKQFRDEIAAGPPAQTNAWHSSRVTLPPLDYSQGRGETSCGEDYKTRENPEHLNVLHARHQKDQMTKVYHKNSEEEYPRRETAPRGVAKNENLSCITNTSSTPLIPDTPILHNSRGDFQHCLSGEWERNRIKIQSSHTGLDTDELIELLKSELSRAVNLSVDLVFKKMFHSLFKTPAQDPDVGSEHALLDENVKYEEATTPNYDLCSQITEPSLPNVQTEALSLVIQKPSNQENPNTFTQVNTSFSEISNPPSQSKQNNFHIDQEVLQRFQDSPTNVLDSLPCQYNTSQSSVDIMSHSWEPIKVTSKGMSNCMSQQAQLVALSQLAFDNLCLPHIKRENQGLVENNSFLPLNIQEGLTPGHLKKAKLMFFYTRYPSSNVLKTFFPDVKFTRCITSQLIKWFSNFREFYYIQMEKFARQAVAEGVGNTRDITMDRDSELFRALNTHYNKANDYQVGHNKRISEVIHYKEHLTMKLPGAQLVHAHYIILVNKLP
ncbi:prospero homeobox protein 1-like isoform X2 [Alosa alosa]|uniref:prospero homeobox protein 1-like isoform X2 n=1 Tax=Alosa alosa TaxID=278164 RepID=UPI0020153512|nr:prospero homeobox protein 1-like isoform X2 [Alosa alosa]